MRVLVCGGRDFNDELAADLALDGLFLPKGSVVIEGGARGADRLARNWAKLNGCHVQTFLADWQKDGRAAGPIRNQRMIDQGKPDLVIAFPGGRGTADMVRRAKTAGIKVREIEPSHPNPARRLPLAFGELG
jgi:hypothetical protein